MRGKKLWIGAVLLVTAILLTALPVSATVTTNVTNFFANVTTPIQIVANNGTTPFNGSINVSITPITATITNGTFSYKNIISGVTVTGTFTVSSGNWINISLNGNSATEVTINTTINAPAGS